MARFEFGGTLASWLVQTVDASASLGDGVEAVVLPTEPVTVPVLDAPGGNAVTDLLDADGNPVTEIVVQPGDPYIPRFQGPDTVEQLWTQDRNGKNLPMPRFDLESGQVAGDVFLAGDNEYEYPDSQQPPWLVVRIPNDGSSSSGWPNRLEFHYYDNDTSQYRVGFHLNEKGLLRTRGVTANDVAVRFMAHPNLSSQWPVMETAGNDNSVKYFQSFEHKTVSNVPFESQEVKVAYFVNPAGERLYFGSADPSTDPAYEDMRPDIGDAWIDFTEEGEGS